MEEFNEIYNKFLVKKAIFSNSIEEFFEKMKPCKTDETYPNFFLVLHDFLNKYQNIYDKKVKENTIDLAEHLLKNIDMINREDKINELNAIKRYLNNLEPNNYEFVKNEIANREFGTNLKSDLTLRWLFKTHNEDGLDRLKDEVYKSICFDLDFISLKTMDQNFFYEKGYAKYTLKKNFYRSLNYCLINCPNILKDKQFIENICYIFYANEEMIDHYQDEYAEIYEEVDDQFLTLEKISGKLLLKRKILKAI